MEITLTIVEARVLGALIEKELATPEYYPMTLNSLCAACNQKSSRNPVMNLMETEILRALETLRSKHLVWERHVAGSRVLKHEHNATGLWSLSQDELAVLCILLLRGPQTSGEIRSRTGRLFRFATTDAVEATINALNHQTTGPFVIRLPVAPGTKEARFAHLLCGEPDVEELQQQIKQQAPVIEVQAENERITELESRVAALEKRVDDLIKQFE